MVALIECQTATLHLPSPVHGVGLCGHELSYPMVAGPLADLYDRCREVCRPCFDEAVSGDHGYQSRGS